MVCRNCGTSLEGRFDLGGLFRLTTEQRHFVEVFIRCEGKLNRVQEELGLSYPTVRNRLEEVIHAMGYQVSKDERGDEERRQDVLQRLASKEISAEEALELLGP
jgi:hypothetical protein